MTLNADETTTPREKQEVSRVAFDTGIVEALALLPPHWGLTTTFFESVKTQ